MFRPEAFWSLSSVSFLDDQSQVSDCKNQFPHICYVLIHICYSYEESSGNILTHSTMADDNKRGERKRKYNIYIS